MSLSSVVEMTLPQKRLWLPGLVCAIRLPGQWKHTKIASVLLLAGHLQVGGGINDANANEWIAAGASKVE